MMHRSSTRLKIAELSNHISCILCGGYYVDATTITECLHSFCRTCIVRYLETSKYCPVCEVQVHKTRPLHYIRSDKTLQDIVYKLVPGLFSNEMKRRREFYGSQPPESLKLSRDDEDRGESLEKRFIYPPEEIISLSVEYGYRKKDNTSELGEATEDMEDTDSTRRYLRCPAAVTVMLLKKFIRMKYGVPSSHQVDLQYQEESLQDDYTLMDVAYIYSWKRSGPMRFFYRILARPPKRMKTHHFSVTTNVKEDHAKANEDVVMKEDNSTLSAVNASVINGGNEEKPLSVSTDDNNNTNIASSATAAIEVSREAAKVSASSASLKTSRDVSSASKAPLTAFKTIKEAASSVSKSAKETASSACKTAKVAASSACKIAKVAASSTCKTAKEAASPAKTAKEAAFSASKIAREAASSTFKTAKETESSACKTSKEAASSASKNAKEVAYLSSKTSKGTSSSPFKTAKETVSFSSKTLKEAASLSSKTVKESAFSAFKSAKEGVLSCQKSAKEAALSAAPKTAKEAAFSASKTTKEASSVEDTSSKDNEEVFSAVPTSQPSPKAPNSDCSIGNASLPQLPSSHAPSNPTAAPGLPSAPAAKEAPLPTASSDRPASSAKEKLPEKTDGFPKEPLKPLSLSLEAKDDSSVSMDLDRDLDIGPLVIAEPEIVPKETESKSSRSSQAVGVRVDKDDEAEGTDDGEVDSGRGSDVSSRAEAHSVDGDEDIGSPASSARTPDLEKPSSLSVASPSSSSLPSPMTTQESNSSGSSAVSEPQKDDIGALDLSTCNRKRGLDRAPPSRPRHVANPPVLDKNRQTNPILPLPKHPSFKLLPAVLPHASIYKKPDMGGRNFRCRGSTLTVINPDPNSCRPKIVIKNLDPRPEHSHSRHHHHHHHNHHHQRM